MTQTAIALVLLLAVYSRPDEVTRLLAILSALVQCRTIVYPAVIGFVIAVVHLVGVKDATEHKIIAVFDKGFGLLAAGVTVWGFLADRQNASTSQRIQNTADQTTSALNETRDTLNVVNPAVSTKDAIAAPLSPVQINPKDKP